MALIIIGQSSCSICHEVLKENDDLIAWQAFLKKAHKFWQFSDTGMHKLCFEDWKHRVEFEKLYKYQPTIDFNDPELIKQIEKFGLPDWLKEIKESRKPLSNHQSNFIK
jgi:hypothetical protein